MPLEGLAVAEGDGQLAVCGRGHLVRPLTWKRRSFAQVRSLFGRRSRCRCGAASQGGPRPVSAPAARCATALVRICSSLSLVRPWLLVQNLCAGTFTESSLAECDPITTLPANFNADLTS